MNENRPIFIEKIVSVRKICSTSNIFFYIGTYVGRYILRALKTNNHFQVIISKL